MELNIENLARAAFPRTAAAQGAKMPRRLLSGIMDAASFPGRTLMAAADATGPTMTLGDIIANQSIPANSTDFLSSMGRTGAMPGRSRADAISESIIRDPISVLGLGAGSLAKAVGGKVAAATGSKVAPKLASYVADLLANSGTDAASQYATTGAIDPRQMALGAGLGLGMQGLGAGAMKIAPKVTQNPNFQKWFGGSKVADEAGNPLVVYHGTNAGGEVFSVFKNPKAEDLGGDWNMFSESPQYSSQFAQAQGAHMLPVALSIQNPLDLSSLPPRRGDARNELISKLRSLDFDVDGLHRSIPYERDLYQIINRKGFREDLVSASKDKGYDGIKMPDSFDENGEDIISVTWIPFSPKQIKSATGNRGTFDPTDPNITHLTGGGTQLPSLQLPGFAKRLGSRYMNDTTATSGRY